ncbi:(Fe-S)-binding protein [Aneurinibacillus uraniidurans]|uniref:(Fe-S)-binding protein n=1 Tax=Aneurinibacillus uraniidurans TaxID=2966586 RepID=UPI00234AB63E|nr:(Fe-S)-binding protein [Aneurinibacillus sp. B1]WCN37451.1 (Fe-S)-binding protein [Aneurinibacillus sp. B1]
MAVDVDKRENMRMEMNKQTNNPDCSTASVSLLNKFDTNEIMNCMQCGFCLPSCPTYRQTGKEVASPRGRIALMKGVAQEALQVDQEFENNMYLCLGCRACETACPAGVPYGSLVETAREVVETNKKERSKSPFIRDIVFNKIFKHPKRIDTLGTALWAAQAAGLQTLADKTGLVNVLPRPMAEMQKAVEKVASPAERKKRQKIVKPTDQTAKLRIGMFKGCIMDVMFYETNQATSRVLAKAGCEVIFVEDQACCGALHAHSGEKDGAVELAKRNIEAFEKANVDFIVNNAGGCGAALKEYHHWFHDDLEWKERALAFVAKTRDANELLAELPQIEFKNSFDVRVTYQDSCHLAHGQGVRNQPRQLIRSIPGVEYIEMINADSCCGSAGIYNITNFDMSMRILDDKMKNVKQTKAHLIVTSNPGCLLQMKQGIIRAGMQNEMEAIHIMDLLDRAL